MKIDADPNIVEPSKYPVNPAGFFIHSAIHPSREDAVCVMHTHTTAGMAMAAADTEILPVDFAGSAAHGRVGYHDFAGVHADESDCAALVERLGESNLPPAAQSRPAYVRHIDCTSVPAPLLV